MKVKDQGSKDRSSYQCLPQDCFCSRRSGQGVWASSKELAVELENLKNVSAKLKFTRCFVLRIDATLFGPQMLLSEVAGHCDQPKLGWAKMEPSVLR